MSSNGVPQGFNLPGTLPEWLFKTPSPLPREPGSLAASEVKVIQRFNGERAVWFLEHNTHPGQRNPKKETLKILREKIESNRFRKATIAVAILKHEGDRVVLLNGQHNCMVIRDTGHQCWATIEIYEVDTEEQVQQLYRQFDNTRGRTTSDHNKAWAVGMGIDYPSRFLNLAISSAVYAKMRESSPHIPRDDRGPFLEPFLLQSDFIYSVLTDGEPTAAKYSHIMRSPVVAIVLMTLKKYPGPAAKFWGGVISGSNLESDDPAFVLREWLKEHSILDIESDNESPQKNSKKAGFCRPKEFYVRTVLHWNRFASGQPCPRAIRYVPDAKSVPEIEAPNTSCRWASAKVHELLDAA